MDSTWLTLGILLAGIIVVIGGILALRLHAFLALTLGALIVSFLTPASFIQQYSLRNNALTVVSIDPDNQTLTLQVPPDRDVRTGTPYLLLRPQPDDVPQEIAQLRIETAEQVTRDDGTQYQQLTASAQDLPTSRTIQPDDLVVSPSARKQAQSLAQETIGERVAQAFGTTAGQIGILIAMASIIGKCLLDSGAADRIVRSALNLMGESGAPAAFLGSGFLLGIPVFFDTVFYLMIPLGKAMRMRTGRNYLLYVLTIVAGGTMAHSLVPPTPGPLFVAEELGVNIGQMILMGLVVGFFTSAFGYFYAHFATRRWELPLRESPEFSLKDLEELSQRDDSQLPPLGFSLLPILLPVLLIAGYTVLERFGNQFSPEFMHLAATLGNKNIALVISAGIAMALLVWQRRTELTELASSVQAALAGGGVIILITSAGGAFGDMLQQTGVANLINQIPQTSPLVIVTLAFLITTAVRTAQGSATVAMITAVGILSGLAESGQLGFDPVYLALAIGCGSKPIAWMNDSGFWVITKMSGMTEAEGLKYVTPMTTLMGFVGLAVVMLGVTFFPLTG